MTKVRVHRNLNKGPNWVLTMNGKVQGKYDYLIMRVDRIIVSDRTIVRCRTPKGEVSELGTMGLGRRTVCCWFEGELIDSYWGFGRLEISFNPMEDWFPYVKFEDEKRYFDMDAYDFVVRFDGNLAVLEQSNVDDYLC